MHITTFGTRGSLPVAGPDKLKYGGNTTCLQVESPCLPAGIILSLDAGTGFLPLSKQALGSGVKRMVVFHTHYHHDHTQGMLIAPPIYIDSLPVDVYGPVEKDSGPREVYESLMRPPLHPVALGSVAHHITFHRIENPAVTVIVIHPLGGFSMIDLETYKRASLQGSSLPFGDEKSFAANECLIVTMHYTDHPERTVAYRFEERPSGKVFVFLTDEEVRASTPLSFKNFLSNADLVIQDAQFGDATYKTRAAGWGHGTPGYVVSLARETGIKKVGLTHHDPMASDVEIDKLLEEAVAARGDLPLEIFTCYDYLRTEV
jgi:phosphoribosyl 1,2-cyclic phosphodiesterase